jgi:hypothetical protein
MEAFKPIPGHPGYEVSDHGTVRSLDRPTTLKGKGGTTYTRWIRGKVLCLRKHPQGYRGVSLANGVQASVHSLVMLTFVGARPEGAWINHRNGNKSDNRLENLEYCSPKQNAEHAVHTGLQPMPPGAGKLTEEDVRTIKSRIHDGERGCDIARDYSVTKECVYAIAKKRIWAWV